MTASLFPPNPAMAMRPSRGTGVQGSHEPKRIHLNVGGERHSPYVSTLKNLADSPLAMILRDECKTELDYDHATDVYFFDRHPGIFSHILNYFQTGKLHCPRDVCGPMFEAELHFWGIDESQMEACCWSTYTKHREIQENLKLLRLRNLEHKSRDARSTNHSLTDQTCWLKYKDLIWEVLDEPYSSPFAKFFSYISLGFIILSIITYSLLSMKTINGTVCHTTENVSCVDQHVCLSNISESPHFAIHTTKYISLHECASICCRNKTCIGFDFNIVSKHCWTKMTKDNESVTYGCGNVSCEESYACLLNKSQYHTNHIYTIENSTSACASRCCANGTCLGFDYDMKTKGCWLSKLSWVKLSPTVHDDRHSCFKVPCEDKTVCLLNTTHHVNTERTGNSTHICRSKCCQKDVCIGFDQSMVTMDCRPKKKFEIDDFFINYQDRFACIKVNTTKCEGMSKLKDITRGFELLFAVWFTIEILLRVLFCPDRVKYISTPSNWVDSMAVIPVYLLYCYPDSKPFMILNMVRYVRVFRLFKLLYDLHILGRTLKASLNQLILLVFIVLFASLVFSSFVHYSEKTWGNKRSKAEFVDMPNTLWWSIIIMTTIGYGDKAPTSPPGRIFGAIAAIIGILLVSMTASILGSSFQQYYTVARAQLKIPHNHMPMKVEERKTLRDQFTQFKTPDNTLSPDSKDSGYGHSPLPTPIMEQDHSNSPPVARQRNVIVTIDNE